MSTICKLDPGVRQARAARRNAIRSLERVIPYLPAARQPAAVLLHHILDNIRRNPKRTGAEKSDSFAAMMRKLMPAELEAA